MIFWYYIGRYEFHEYTLVHLDAWTMDILYRVCCLA